MDYRIISFQGQQYLLKPGSTFTVPGELGAAGSTLKADTLFINQAGKYAIGTPHLTETSSLTLVSSQKSKKIRVATYRAKSRYRRVKGHRQMETTLRFDAAKPAKSASKSAAKA